MADGDDDGLVTVNRCLISDEGVRIRVEERPTRWTSWNDARSVVCSRSKVGKRGCYERERLRGSTANEGERAPVGFRVEGEGGG